MIKEFEVLTDVALIKNDSWVYAQYISIPDIESKDFFSGYIIANKGDSVPLIKINDQMWYLFVSDNSDEINEKIPKYDCVLLYKSKNGRVTLRGQSLGISC